MVPDFLVQLMIEVVSAVQLMIGYHSIYLGILARFVMLVLFINSNLMEFHVRSFRSFFSSLQFQAVLDGNHKNNQLLLVFRKAPNLIFIFFSSFYT